MLRPGDPAPLFRVTDALGRPFDLAEALREGQVALFFLRYTGCPICQMQIAGILRDLPRFRRTGAQVAVVVENGGETLARYLEQNPLPFTVLPDPERALYGLYGVDRGGIKAVVAPGVLVTVLKATVRGFRHGKFEGSQTQVPADFVIGRSGRLRRVHYGKDIADSSPNEALLACLETDETATCEPERPHQPRRS